jgi:hypothetical protein
MLVRIASIADTAPKRVGNAESVNKSCLTLVRGQNVHEGCRHLGARSGRNWVVNGN